MSIESHLLKSAVQIIQQKAEPDSPDGIRTIVFLCHPISIATKIEEHARREGLVNQCGWVSNDCCFVKIMIGEDLITETTLRLCWSKYFRYVSNDWASAVYGQGNTHNWQL